MTDSTEPADEYAYSSADEHPQDLAGCFVFAFRTTGCMLWLQLTMFLAIICAAVLSLLFFR